jgi:hypothetical protein
MVKCQHAPPRPAAFALKWCVISFFSLGWSETAILISASQVARITGVSHWHLAHYTSEDLFFFRVHI